MSELPESASTMLPHRMLIVCSLVAFTAACARPKPSVSPSETTTESLGPGAAGESTEESFEGLLVRFAENDRRRSWTSAECQRLGRDFAEVSARHQQRSGRQLSSALYNAGLAFQRCGADAEAKRLFSQAGTFVPARTELVVAEDRASPDRDHSIERLKQVVSDSKFQDQRALVLLAALLLNRAREQADGSRERELARAHLQRALEIDDAYAPALNQLAVYYLELARAHAAEGEHALAASASFSTASVQPRRPRRRHLELASLVVERALERHPEYAPVHNTEGVIYVELGNYAGAGRAFARARQLDPDFFEAHMNYAALSLRLLGFIEAELAYRAAVALEPKNYEAHMGLALALRGQLAPENLLRLEPEIERTLASAAKVAPLRPEVDYNRALFALARARSQLGADAVRAFERARADFRRFVDRAGDQPRYAREVLRAREHLDDLRDAAPFLPQLPLP